MSKRTLLLFSGTSVIWGSSFLFIRVAVEHMPPSAVVFGRTLLGAAFLVPLALKSGAFRGLRSHMPAVVMVTLLDMALPGGPARLSYDVALARHVTGSATDLRGCGARGW